MTVSFSDPLWLVGLPLAAVVVWLGLRAVTRRRSRWDQRLLATWARAAAVGLLVLALAGPRVEAAGRDLDVAFLLDASDSVTGSARRAGEAWVADALAAKPPDDRAALALFGRDARMEYPLSYDPPGGRPVSLVDGGASDLARALRLAEGLLGNARRRRVVLLSDGRQTEGDLLSTVRQLAEAGIGVDVVALSPQGGADVLVEEVRAPSRARQGEAYDVTAVLRNTGGEPASAEVTLHTDGAEIARRTVTVPPGATTEVVVGRVAGEPGTMRYEARLASGASTVDANDVGRAAVTVDGPPRVLVYQRAAGLGDDLVRALGAAGVPADLRTADQEPLPPLDALLDYDSAVLVDVPVEALGAAGMVTLDQFVRDAGHGLVAVGGDTSFGMGGYDGTPLEALLPVFARVNDPLRRPSVAEALVVDSSGSMAACHCSDAAAFGAPPASNGAAKTDIAKEAIVRAVEELEANDQIGVLAFNTRSEWVVPLQRLPADAVIDRGLARLRPHGNTDIHQAIREAIAGLKDAEARLRHIVLFSDGFMGDTRGLEDVAREAAAAGITLSVVGTGEGSYDVLRQMALAGGGRYYPGRNLAEIPDIIALELEQVARPIVNEGEFYPTVTGLAAATEALDASPPLAGYLATTAKPTARTLLQIGAERDPLLAVWRAGLGTTAAWTSDATARWSSQWVTWERFATFWADVIKDTFPAGPDPGVEVAAAAAAEGLRVRVTVPAPGSLEGAEATATVTDPAGRRQQIALDRTSLTDFEALVPAAAEGVYAVSAAIRAQGGAVLRGTATAIRSYAAEYAGAGADPDLLARAVEAAGGRLNPRPGQAFDRAGLAPGASTVALWPYLASVALALAVADVGLRRLRLERADVRRLRVWVRDLPRRLSGRTVNSQEPVTMTDLFAAKARARARERK